MAFQKSLIRFDKIFVGALGLLLGVIGLVVAYKAASDTTESRSKAAEEQAIYRSWEFNGRDLEGWSAIAPSTAVVRNGALVLQAAKAALPAIRNANVATQLPKGLKTMSFSMAVGPVQAPSGAAVQGREGSFGKFVQGVADETDDAAYKQAVQERVACTMEARLCPDGSSVGKSGATCQFLPCPVVATANPRNPRAPVPQVSRKYTAIVYYQASDKKRFERPLLISGTIDGKFQTHTVTLSEINPVTIKTLRIVFLSGVKPGEFASIDWIRLSGAKTTSPTRPPTSTPILTPTPTPKPPVSATYTPTPTFIEGSNFKKAVLLNGASYIRATNSEAIQPALGFTVEAWFKPDVIAQQGSLISKMSGSQNSFRISVMSEEDPQDASKVRFVYTFGVVNSGNNCLFHNITNQVLVQKDSAFNWQHVAAVVQNDGQMFVYVNGQKLIGNTNSISGVCARTMPVTVGATELSPGDVNGYLNGKVDEVRISNSARYTSNFTPSLSPFTNYTNDMILYHLDGINDSGLVLDESGSGRDGQLFGAVTFVEH